MGSPELIGKKIYKAVEPCLPEQLPARITVQASHGCKALASDTQFICILAELINNCVEKRAKNIEVHVSIDFDTPTRMFHMEVEDTVVYDPATAEKLLRKLNKGGNVRTADKRRDITKYLEYGSGIIMARNFLSSHEGSLLYRQSDDHRIIAEAKWK